MGAAHPVYRAARGHRKAADSPWVVAGPRPQRGARCRFLCSGSSQRHPIATPHARSAAGPGPAGGIGVRPSTGGFLSGSPQLVALGPCLPWPVRQILPPTRRRGMAARVRPAWGGRVGSHRGRGAGHGWIAPEPPKASSYDPLFGGAYVAVKMGFSRRGGYCPRQCSKGPATFQSGTDRSGTRPFARYSRLRFRRPAMPYHARQYPPGCSPREGARDRASENLPGRHRGGGFRRPASDARQAHRFHRLRRGPPPEPWPPFALDVEPSPLNLVRHACPDGGSPGRGMDVRLTRPATFGNTLTSKK